eukprot:4587602-Prymnesium_polylepis.1
MVRAPPWPPLKCFCDYVTGNGRYEKKQRLCTRVDAGSCGPQATLGSCIARRPAFSHGARPRPA